MRPGHSIIGLDQGLESFLPIWCVKDELNLGWSEIVSLVFAFLVLELIISPILCRFHIRHDPY
ncbi:MAG: hypothetical protein ACUVQ6_05145 [Dissulfurimicrobium sp.]|uniref:hypothetical protein n=1 Tax=Dissulfurimicrobium sp. TaxID=2022436 RepID=UPI0040491044